MCVKTATISGVTHGSVVDAYTVISCTADVNAYPPAIYRWTNHVDNSLSAGPQFVLQPGTQYKLTCTAYNNFDRCNATNYVEFNSKLTYVMLQCVFNTFKHITFIRFHALNFIMFRYNYYVNYFVASSNLILCHCCYLICHLLVTHFYVSSSYWRTTHNS